MLPLIPTLSPLKAMGRGGSAPPSPAPQPTPAPPHRCHPGRNLPRRRPGCPGPIGPHVVAHVARPRPFPVIPARGAQRSRPGSVQASDRARHQQLARIPAFAGMTMEGMRAPATPHYGGRLRRMSAETRRPVRPSPTRSRPCPHRRVTALATRTKEALHFPNTSLSTTSPKLPLKRHPGSPSRNISTICMTKLL